MNIGREKIISSGKWVTLTTVSVSAIGVITTVLLPKLIKPEDFGLFALGGMLGALAQKLAGFGQGEFIIYKQVDKEKVERTAFTTFLISNTLLFLLQLLLARKLAAYFNNDRLTALYVWMSLGYLITAFSLIPGTMLSKELHFKKKFWPELLGVTAYTIVALVLALAGWGVWALVFSGIVSNLITMLGLIWVTKWKPRFGLDQSIFKELLNYGMPLCLNGFLVYLWFNIDRFYIGKLLNAEQLGYYAVGFQFAYLIPMKINQIIQSVAFPAYSSMNGAPAELNHIYIRSFSVTCFTAGLVAAVTFYAAEPFITFMYGAAWRPTSEVMKLFSLFSFASMLSVPPVSLFLSRGRTNWLVWFTLFGLAAITLAMPSGISHGIQGVALAMTTAVCLYTGVLVAASVLLMPEKGKEMSLHLFYPIMLPVILVQAVVKFTNLSLFTDIPVVPKTLIGATLLAIVYSGLNYAANGYLRKTINSVLTPYAKR